MGVLYCNIAKRLNEITHKSLRTSYSDDKDFLKQLISNEKTPVIFRCYSIILYHRIETRRSNYSQKAFNVILNALPYFKEYPKEKHAVIFVLLERLEKGMKESLKHILLKNSDMSTARLYIGVSYFYGVRTVKKMKTFLKIAEINFKQNKTKLINRLFVSLCQYVKSVFDNSKKTIYKYNAYVKLLIKYRSQTYAVPEIFEKIFSAVYNLYKDIENNNDIISLPFFTPEKPFRFSDNIKVERTSIYGK